MSNQAQTSSENKLVMLHDELDLLLSERNECPYCSNETFSQYVQKFLDMKKMNAQKFCSRTGLSAQIFTRLQDDNYKPSLSTIIAICIGLKISLESSEQLIKSAGFNLCNSVEHACYKVLLLNSTKITTDDANEFLTAQGFKAISEKDYYKSRKTNSSTRKENEPKPGSFLYKQPILSQK